MAEVLVQFDEPQRTDNGRSFVAQVWGRWTPGGLWEAWIEFLPTDGGDPIRTGRETEQWSRSDLRYWSTGLTRVYLEGALRRALTPQAPSMVQATTAPPVIETLVNGEHTVLETSSLVRPLPLFDPFAVYLQNGDYALRQELRALDARQLRTIITQYDIPDIDTIDMARTFEDALAEQIVAGVQQRVGSKRGSVTLARPRATDG